MSDKPKGIVDPWRMVDPLRKPKPVRMDLEDIDLDGDLAIPGRHTIRTAHCSIDVVHVRVESPKDALDVLAECIAEAWRVKLVGIELTKAGVGIRCRAGVWNAPDAETPASTLKGETTVIWFIQKPLDQGMLNLVKILRTPAAAAVIKKWGVTPMING